MTWAEEANAALRAELCRFFPHDWVPATDGLSPTECSRCGAPGEEDWA